MRSRRYEGQFRTRGTLSEGCASVPVDLAGKVLPSRDPRAPGCRAQNIHVGAEVGRRVLTPSTASGT